MNIIKINSKVPGIFSPKKKKKRSQISWAALIPNNQLNINNRKKRLKFLI